MKSTLAALALAVSAHALVAREEPCCFSITAYGGPGGPVGQLSDGQNRIGNDNLPAGSYCIDSNGGLTDQNGRGCILTPPTTQFQCDEGAKPTGGFTIESNGTMSYGDSTTFFACATGMNHGWNLYTQEIDGSACQPVWLVADNGNCGANSAPPAAPNAAPPAPASPAGCPADLTGPWGESALPQSAAEAALQPASAPILIEFLEFPHLIIPVNAADAEKAYGTQYNGTAYGAISSIFNFDIPESYAGQQCTLRFLFPEQSQLETSAYEYSPGQFAFSYLNGPVTQSTTYANAPRVAYGFGHFGLKPGSATTIGYVPDGCPAGQQVAIYLRALGDASINYFQDSNPCPIGLYITAA